MASLTGKKRVVLTSTLGAETDADALSLLNHTACCLHIWAGSWTLVLMSSLSNFY
jgi:hypothetical protein